jgi:hypothetical protein
MVLHRPVGLAGVFGKFGFPAGKPWANLLKTPFSGRSRPYPDAPFGSIYGLEWLLQTTFGEHSLGRLDFIFDFR